MKSAHLRVGAFVLFAGLLVGALASPRSSEGQPTKSVEAATPHPATGQGSGRWVEVGRETFDRLSFLSPPTWRPDTPDNATSFSDNGAFFHEHNPAFQPPAGFRITAALGQGFLTVESYSRAKKEFKSLCDLAEDPAQPGNHVLRLASPDHTDGTILRTTNALGTRYQICARVGYMDFGMGDGLNGYHGFERNEPWLDGLATGENGFYFGAIYRSLPMPHNNVWSHHERIAFIDSDNNTQGWSAIWDPTTKHFFKSGWHPVVMGVLDGRHSENDLTGPPILAYAGGDWNAPGEIVAVDAYKENTWYTVCFTRMDNTFTLRISGDFRFGGKTTYEVTIPDASQVFHYSDPHYWCLGDPHINYYEGSLLVDDIVLSVWRAQ